MGVFILFSVVVIALKLYSFIHFWYDVRLFIENKKRLLKNDPKTLELQQNIYQKIEDVISKYPKNLSLKKFNFHQKNNNHIILHDFYENH